jgi:drug/metabolite transporter (DMT)-like permease
VADVLALTAAFLFALAAALQQKGALNLPTLSLAQPMSLVRLLGQTMWLLGRRHCSRVAGILIGVLLLDETLSRPAWHVVVAVVGLSLTLAGAVVISLAREAAGDERGEHAADAVVATA